MVVLQANKFFYLRGGSERYMFLLMDALQRRGHGVVHFSMTHPDNTPSPHARYFVRPKEYDGAKFRPADAISFIRSREAARKIGALISETHPDVAHVHNIYHQLTPSIIDVLASRGVPVVMTAHDYKLVCPNYSMFAHGRYCYKCKGGAYYNAALTKCSGGSVLRGVTLSVEAYWQRLSGVYGKIARILAPSRFMRDTLVAGGYPANRVVYVPNFVSEPEATRPLTDGESGTLASLPQRYLLYFGRLSLEKGLHTLIEALESREDVPVVLCGGGPEENALRRAAEQRGMRNVIFTGHLDSPLLRRIIASSSAVVVPSVCSENAPYGVLEAVVAGVPVIVSDAGGLPELAAAFDGLSFRAGDAAELGRRIDEVWADDRSMRQRGAGAQRVALEQFGEERHLDHVESIYRNVIAEARQ